MNVETTQLLLPKPPWLLRSTSEISSIEKSLANVAMSKKIIVRRANAHNMLSTEGVLKELGIALDFPNYYGQNSAAFHECATDLEWLPADAYILVITNSELLLINDSAEISWLTDELSHVCEEWSNPVALGELWDRPAKPFHVVFQYTDGQVTKLLKSIAAISELSIKCAK